MGPRKGFTKKSDKMLKPWTVVVSKCRRARYVQLTPEIQNINFSDKHFALGYFAGFQYAATGLSWSEGAQSHVESDHIQTLHKTEEECRNPPYSGVRDHSIAKPLVGLGRKHAWIKEGQRRHDSTYSGTYVDKLGGQISS
jgi:hypothetical protein